MALPKFVSISPFKVNPDNSGHSMLREWSPSILAHHSTFGTGPLSAAQHVLCCLTALTWP
jgi:hypothetical protein